VVFVVWLGRFGAELVAQLRSRQRGWFRSAWSALDRAVIVFRWERSAPARARSSASRFTMVGAAKNDIPGQRARRA
jgi:hypothetical protein